MGTVKIALTTSGNDLNSPLDSRFGLAPKFLIYDLDDGSFEVIDNQQNLNATQGAGIQSAQIVAGSGAQALVTGHPEAMGPKYSHKDKQVKKIGMPDSAKEIIRDLEGKGRVVWTEIPTEVVPGLFVTSRIPRNTDFEDSGGKFFIHPCCQTTDELLDDQAIFFETKRGLVVLLGCAHAGVVNTLNYVTRLIQRSHIHAVIGGMHLLNANLTRIDNTIEVFKKYEVQIIAPLHCTGLEATKRIQHALGDKYRPLKAGVKISL